MVDHARDRLSFADILAMAERESGAFGLADEGVVARATAIVDWINAQGPYPAHDVRAMGDQIRRLLSARLGLALDRVRYPKIAEEKIDRPIFIIGFSRSGTTLLHSLLAEHPDVMTGRSWHMYAPSPPPGAGPVAAERIAYANRMVEAWMDFCPAQKQMHPYVDKRGYQLVEDEEIFTLDFRNAYPYYYYHVPTLEPAAVGLGGDQDGAFRFHRMMLQHLQWNDAKRRWVCKGTSAQQHLGALLEVYPDALCVWAHRPLGEIYASNVAVRAATYDTIQGRANDWSAQARDVAMGMKAAVDRLLADRMLDDPRIMHLSFREIAADPVGVVRRICERCDLPAGEAFDTRVRAWLDDPENAAHRFGRYPYSFEAFGLDRAWIDTLFADYSRRFGL